MSTLMTAKRHPGSGRFTSSLNLLLIAVVVLVSGCGGSSQSDTAPQGDGQSGTQGEDIDPASCTEVFSSADSGIVSEPVTLSNSSGDCDYYIDGSYRFTSRVTIEAGTSIVVGAGTGLRFAEGQLIAAGTPDQRITIRGQQDIQGYWSGITLMNMRPSRLEYLDIQNGGTGSSAQLAAGLSIAFSTVSIIDVSVARSFAHGLSLGGGTQLTELSSVKLAGNALEGLLVAGELVHQLDQESDYAGLSEPNQLSGIKVSPDFFSIPGSVTWESLNAPYRIVSMNVSDGENLTLSPGTRLLFDSQNQITVMQGGSLNALGTPQEPVIFEPVPAATGPWRGLSIGGSADLKHVVIDGAGDIDSFTGVGYALELRVSGSLRVEDTLISNSANDGLVCSEFAGGGRGDIQIGNNLLFEDNAGVDLDPRCQ